LGLEGDIGTADNITGHNPQISQIHRFLIY